MVSVAEEDFPGAGHVIVQVYRKDKWLQSAVVYTFTWWLKGSWFESSQRHKSLQGLSGVKLSHIKHAEDPAVVNPCHNGVAKSSFFLLFWHKKKIKAG